MSSKEEVMEAYEKQILHKDILQAIEITRQAIATAKGMHTQGENILQDIIDLEIYERSIQTVIDAHISKKCGYNFRYS